MAAMKDNSASGNEYQVFVGKQDLADRIKALPWIFDTTGIAIYVARNVVKEMNWGDLQVVVKSFKIPGRVRGAIYGSYRKSKARRSYENSLELTNRKIETPEPLGFLECYFKSSIKRSFYVSKKWEADFTFRDPLFKDDFPDRQEILAEIGRFSWNMHMNEVYHRDFSSGNILVKATGASKWTFALVDVNRMHFRALTFRERMKSFAPLWASDKDLTTIVKAYTEASKDNLTTATSLALSFSRNFKKRALIKEKIKSFLIARWSLKSDL